MLFCYVCLDVWSQVSQVESLAWLLYLMYKKKINVQFERLHSATYLTRIPKTFPQLCHLHVKTTKQGVISIIAVDIIPHAPFSPLSFWWFESVNSLALTSWWISLHHPQMGQNVYYLESSSRELAMAVTHGAVGLYVPTWGAKCGFNYAWLPAVTLYGPLIERKGSLCLI